MTTAEHVKQSCEGSIAATYEGGYAMFADGTRKLFPPCHVVTERRNKKGRVSFLHGTYEDGSAIEFRYSENRGASLKAI